MAADTQPSYGTTESDRELVPGTGEERVPDTCPWPVPASFQICPRFVSMSWYIEIAIYCFVMTYSSSEPGAIVPYFTPEAEEKGLSLSYIGANFGLNYLLLVILYPTVGYYIAKREPRRMIFIGVIIVTISNCGFGLLHWSPPVPWFAIFFSSLILVYNAGFIMIMVACFTGAVIGRETDSSFIYSCLEAGYQLGFMVGPLAGGLLFQYGGVVWCTVPVALLGLVILLPLSMLLPEYGIMPPGKSGASTPTRDTTAEGLPLTERYPAVAVIREPLAFAVLVVTAFQASGAAFVNVFVVKHLNEYGLNSSQTGTVLFLAGAVFVTCSPIIGHLNDKYNKAVLALFLGCIISIVGYCLAGPMEILPKHDWTEEYGSFEVCLGVVLTRIGLAFTLGPSTKVLFNVAALVKIPETRIGAVISVIYNAAFCLGGFLGLAVGGWSMQDYGFSRSSFVIAIVIAVAAVILLLACGLQRLRHPPVAEEESAPLTGSPSHED